MNTKAVLEALRDHFPAAEYALLTEVRNCTGFSQRVRSADMLVQNLWPSRGLELWGIEIKVSRSDWMKELRNPEKAEEIARFCHRWFVCAPVGIVAIEELPPTWGLLEVEKGKVKLKRPAEKREAQPPALPFFASLMRSVCDSWVPANLVDKRIADALGETEKIVEERLKLRQSWAEKELQKLRAQVEAFEKSSGITLQGWDAGNKNRFSGEAVKILRDWLDFGPPARLANTASWLRQAGENLEKLHAEAVALTARGEHER